MMIVNTRPKSLSINLKKLAMDLGIEINNIHMSKINFIAPKEDSICKIQNIDSYKNIIFTSQNSVINGLKIIEDFHSINSLNNNFLTTGPSTSNKLLQKGVRSISPLEHSSKGILDLIRTNFPGKNLLFCGNNSNGFLQKSLNEDLDEIICYEVSYLPEEVKKITNIKEVLLIYNFGTFQFLIDHLDKAILENKIFIVASERIKKKLDKEHRGLEVYVSSGPSDKMMISMAKNFI